MRAQKTGDGDRLHWPPAPHSLVERGDSLPEHGRRRAFPRLPLIDDGLPRGAHQRGQLRLAQAARATKRANLLSVVAWNAGPGQWRATIIWADRPPIVRLPKRSGRGGSRTGPEAAKGRPGVIGDGRRPSRAAARSVFTCTPISNASTGPLNQPAGEVPGSRRCRYFASRDHVAECATPAVPVLPERRGGLRIRGLPVSPSMRRCSCRW